MFMRESFHKRGIILLSCMAVLTFLLATPMWGQSTIATGSIQGTVTDPNDAVVPNASVTITNSATGEAKKVTTSSSGTFASGALTPGAYEVRIEAQGFQTVLTKILREEWGFKGVTVSDYFGINELVTRHKLAATPMVSRRAGTSTRRCSRWMRRRGCTSGGCSTASLPR